MRRRYKTKFPVARIKKIMQLDEDVGKVAQATPVLISKALELFMQSLIDEACVETRAKNAKRLTVAHLKKTIQDKDQFDFLRDIVANVADPAESKTAASAEKGEGSSSSPSSAPTPRRGRAPKSAAAAAGPSSSAPRARRGRKPSSNGDVKMAEDDDDDEEEEEEEEQEEDEEEQEMEAAPQASFAMMESMAGRTKIGGGSLARKGKSARDEDEDDYDA